MDVIGSVVVSVLVIAVGVLLSWVTSGRFDEVNRRFEAVDRRFEAVDHRFDEVNHRFDEVHERIARLEDRFDTRMDSFQASVDGRRSDLTAVALAVGARPRGHQAGSRS